MTFGLKTAMFYRDLITVIGTNNQDIKEKRVHFIYLVCTMASSSFSDRVATVDASQFDDDQADENEARLNNKPFIQTDRSRTVELAEESQTPSAAAHGRPVVPGRHLSPSSRSPLLCLGLFTSAF